VIRVIEYKGVMIQEWFGKFSYRDNTGQWYEFNSLGTAQKGIDA